MTVTKRALSNRLLVPFPSLRVAAYLKEPVSNAPLVTFRILFGLLMMGATLRFWLKGWIAQQYLQPTFYFRHYGFAWLPHPSAGVLYAIFGLMLLSALGIALGWFYRWSAVLFFLSFTYVELLDKTYYLNHYYFIILISLLLIFIPAHQRLSLDALQGRCASAHTAPRIFLVLLRFQVGVVYFFAGIAKLNGDWLMRAVPMRIWLAANANKPLVGALLAKKFTAYLFSWAGMFYDILIPWLLLIRKTRILAFVAVVLFHLLTGWLFPIGMFPVVMVFSTLIFFSEAWHERVIGWMETRLETQLRYPRLSSVAPTFTPYWSVGVGLYLAFQLLFPLRYLLYPGNLFWTEEGYRFSWRVMLMEKMGDATFYLEDQRTKQRMMVYNREHLTPLQEKMMVTQPDMIVQYAQYLKAYGQAHGMHDPTVTADVFVTLNGRRSRRFVDPVVDLAALHDGWSPKSWILSE